MKKALTPKGVGAFFISPHGNNSIAALSKLCPAPILTVKTDRPNCAIMDVDKQTSGPNLQYSGAKNDNSF